MRQEVRERKRIAALLVKLMSWKTMSSVGLRTRQVSSEVINVEGRIKRGRVSIENVINNDSYCSSELYILSVFFLHMK